MGAMSVSTAETLNSGSENSAFSNSFSPLILTLPLLYNICSYGMDLFQREGEKWYRSFEEHKEYAYSVMQLTDYLKAAGFTHIRVYADGKLEAPKAGEQRIYFSARKGIRK